MQNDFPFSWRNFLSCQALSAVIGDFNGDGKPDAALLGRDKTHRLRIALLSDTDGYRAVEFDARIPLPKKPEKMNLESYLTLVEPRKIPAEPAYERPEIDLKTQAFALEYFGKASTLYRFDRGRFEKFALSV